MPRLITTAAINLIAFGIRPKNESDETHARRHNAAAISWANCNTAEKRTARYAVHVKFLTSNTASRNLYETLELNRHGEHSYQSLMFFIGMAGGHEAWGDNMAKNGNPGSSMSARRTRLTSGTKAAETISYTDLRTGETVTLMIRMVKIEAGNKYAKRTVIAPLYDVAPSPRRARKERIAPKAVNAMFGVMAAVVNGPVVTEEAPAHGGLDALLTRKARKGKTAAANGYRTAPCMLIDLEA